MRKLSSYLISVFLIALFSTSVYAAKNEICEPLKADGVTKGLYGLCIAYHASGANSQVILDNYNRKKSDSDPVMPGTDDDPLGCPCWSTLALEDIGTTPDVPANSCVLSTDIDFLFYDGSAGTEILNASEGSCTYFNSVTGADAPPITGLNEVDEFKCRDEIIELAERDFQILGCNVL